MNGPVGARSVQIKIDLIRLIAVNVNRKVLVVHRFIGAIGTDIQNGLAERIAQNARSERVDEAAEARCVDRALSVSEGHFEDSFQAIRGLRVRDRLGEIETPTLVVSGGADWLLTANLQDVQLLPNASLHVLSRVGHRVPTEVPSALARVLADFMEHGVVNAATIASRVDEMRAAATR